MPSPSEPNEFVEPSPSVAEANRHIINTIPPSPEDYEDAARGLIALPDVPVIRARDNKEKVVWNFADYEFLAEGGDAPPTVNASLWRQGQLTVQAGLFQVTSNGPRTVYQVRGYDLSNMTIITGDTGLVIVDPLTSFETAQAALALYRKATGDTRPITGLLYTHPHVDHFGGSRGLFADNNGDAPVDLPVYAPQGFLDHAISENVFAGPAMSRRADYMYAPRLDKGPHGQVGSGLGLTVSTGELTLVTPNEYIGGPNHQPVAEGDWHPTSYVIPWRPGLYQATVDGVQMIFQLTPNTEAPAEMNIYLPEARALLAAENATHTMHNILSLRGAQVRDPHAWSKYLTEAIQTFGEHTDVVFASHHWPRWGKENILTFLASQRDMYGYLNDQTLRLIDAGYTGIEIAEQLQHLPAGLADHWYNRGYYGSMSHNTKAIYQRYIGWFDGNPAHLWSLPPVEAGVQYVTAMGGPKAALDIARTAYESEPPQYRWAAEVLNHIIFASGAPDAPNEPGKPDALEIPADILTQAKELQAKVFTQLGYGCENGTWRNFYLTGARELQRLPEAPISTGAADLVRSMTLEQFFSALAKSIDGPLAASQQRKPIALRWKVTPGDQTCVTTLRNGVLVYVEGDDPLTPVVDATVTLSRQALEDLALAGHRFTQNFDDEVKKGTIQVDNQAAADTVWSYLRFPDPVFPIVTPRRYQTPVSDEPGPVTA
ncbi:MULTISPECIES: alkyl sulfatase dimerization domain-containing protein [Streptomyces]|uniref:Alkyl sulfatase dimerization domain-containing protein n=1 Tax=Streptomyces luteosporeus TaxID=173856 RepID=A0ABN3TJ31_9ACTN